MTASVVPNAPVPNPRACPCLSSRPWQAAFSWDARGRLSRHGRAAATVGGLALIGVAAQGPACSSRSAKQRDANVARPACACRSSLRSRWKWCSPSARLRELPLHSSARCARCATIGDGRSHWCASTPAGRSLEWDTVTTKYVPNRVIAWQSVPGSPVEHEWPHSIRLPRRTTPASSLELDYQVRDRRDWLTRSSRSSTPRREAELERDIRRLVDLPPHRPRNADSCAAALLADQRAASVPRGIGHA